MNEWESELERLGGAVRPTTPMTGEVRDAVRRRLRRRRTAGAVGIAGMVAAVIVTTSTVTGGGASAPSPEVAASPSEGADSGRTSGAEPVRFDCRTGLDFLPEPPPIDDLARQQAIVDQLVGPDFSGEGYDVVHAEPTHLGIVALVTGDLGAARRALGDSALVEAYDPSGPEVGMDARAQVQQVIGWRLDPVVRELRRATPGIPGDAGLAYWQEAGAVVVRWARPVPAEVAALLGERPDGVEVRLIPTTYSDRDVRIAQGALQDYLNGTGLRSDWSTAYGCNDGTGLVVGMVPPVEDAAALEEALAVAVGMPVKVVPEERPVPTTG